MKASDYIAEFIAKQNVKHVFCVTGGCIVHTLDSISNRNDITIVPVQHEQAGAMAAEAYSRVSDNLGVMITTSGPGATNLLTGTCCSYYDSIPVLNITGQVAKDQMKGDTGCRQVGFQETGVVDIYRSVTKYADLVDKAEDLRYKLEKAAYVAKEGRPGPVFLDICDNVQQAQIDPKSLRPYNPEPKRKDTRSLDSIIDQTFSLLERAKRPVVIIGAGVKLAEAVKEAKSFVEKLGFPIAPTWGAMDFIPYNHNLMISPFGITSHRAGNFAVQNSDLILALGTRLDTHEVGPKPSTFARGAKKIVLDIDKSELQKYEKVGMHVDIPILADVRDFFSRSFRRLESFVSQDISEWKNYIRDLKKEFPICPPDYYKRKKQVDPYVFMDALSRNTKGNEFIIPDCGGNLIWTMQGLKLKDEQKLFTSFNHSPMGYAVPAAMGAAFATTKPIICITGDGGMQMNIQELATISHYKQQVKIFLMNNHGHGIIKQTLRTRVSGKYVGVDDKSGLGIPNLRNVTEAYRIPTLYVGSHRELDCVVKETLRCRGPILCEVDINHEHEMIPKLASNRPYIEDCAPFLPDAEFSKWMRYISPISRK
ncbi:MAG: thiamine pyrophosphate-binding protein [Nanoarchaeota archaeon]